MRVVCGGAIALAFVLVQVESVGFEVASFAAIVMQCMVAAGGLCLFCWGCFVSRYDAAEDGAVLALAAVFGMAVSVLLVGPAQVRASKARGDAVGVALAAYQQAHGSYPSSLNALVPDLLAEVPSTWMSLVRTLRFDSEAFTTCWRNARGGWRSGS